jgi:hypothetical protein
MNGAYNGCTNLKTAVCGDNVQNMAYSYYNCRNLTTAVCGPNVTNMAYCYSNCGNLQGNAYFYANNVVNFRNCMVNRDVVNMLNVYVHAGSNTLTKCLNTSATYSLVGKAITYTNDIAANGCYYNTSYNLYIYPVDNVASIREINGD